MKKLLIMLLALVMVLSVFGCSSSSDDGAADAGDSGEASGDAAAFDSGVRRITIFQNNIGEMATSEQPWAEGSEVIYNAYSLSEYAEKNFLIAPADDAYASLVAGTDYYGTASDWATYKEYYLAIEGDDNCPITCGVTNNKGSNPFNVEFILIGDEAIIVLDCPGTKVGTVSGWISYLSDAEFPFAEGAETYDVVKVDGSTETVAAADIDSIAIADIVSIVPTGFVA